MATSSDLVAKSGPKGTYFLLRLPLETQMSGLSIKKVYQSAILRYQHRWLFVLLFIIFDFIN